MSSAWKLEVRDILVYHDRAQVKPEPWRENEAIEFNTSVEHRDGTDGF